MTFAHLPHSRLRHIFSKAVCTTSRASSSCRRFFTMKRYTLSAYVFTHSLYSLSVINSRCPVARSKLLSYARILKLVRLIMDENVTAGNQKNWLNSFRKRKKTGEKGFPRSFFRRFLAFDRLLQGTLFQGQVLRACQKIARLQMPRRVCMINTT